MTKPKHSVLSCSQCGAKLGTKPGETVVLGLLCNDPLCTYQPTPGLNAVRDSLVVAAAMDGIRVQTVAAATEMSRQRVYQIFDTWKQGA